MCLTPYLRSWARARRPGVATFRRTCSVLLLAVWLASMVGQAAPVVRAQTFFGATLTVLRGTAAVLRADGTPISPAASGLTLGPGDQVATLARSSALVTFFE